MLNLHTLPNGLTIVHEPSSSAVTYCGYVIKTGTRHERDSKNNPFEESGMAHFVEHLTFKGTSRRTSLQISNTLERVGGELNAFTNKQETTYFAVVLKPDLKKAVDILTDIVFHSTYPEKELRKEADVVCDEIESYRDTPSELIFDEFEQMVFRGHPLGRDILGSEERLRTYTHDDIRAFADRHYRTRNAVFFLYGDADFGKLTKLLERHTSDLADYEEVSAPTSIMPEYQAEERIVEKQTHQAHVLMGGRGLSGCDPRRYGLMLLNNILGGNNMSSRLNVSLREHAGLVYSIGSYLFTYPDAGAWGIYFGCDPKDVNRCRKLVTKELTRFVDKPLAPTTLNAAKKQLKGQIALAQDVSEHHALALGKNFARYGRILPLEEIFTLIDDIKATTLQDLAMRLYNPEQLTILTYR